MVTKTALSDTLIAEFGQCLYQSKKKHQSLYVISNRIRECGRFLIHFRTMKDVPDMFAILKESYYDVCLETLKIIARFDPETRSFDVPSLALHFDTTLADLAALAKRLLYQNKFPTRANISDNEVACKHLINELVADIEQFYHIDKTQWHGDRSQVKRPRGEKKKKPKLIPLTEDVMMLKKYLEEKVEEAYKKLASKVTKDDYTGWGRETC